MPPRLCPFFGRCVSHEPVLYRIDRTNDPEPLALAFRADVPPDCCALIPRPHPCILTTAGLVADWRVCPLALAALR